MDYKNGKIYRIVCEETQKQYIGSTCSTLVKRLSNHKTKGNRCTTKDFINPKIILIEDYPCERKDQLLMRERYHMENTECVNFQLPITSKEDKILQRKQWDIDNADKIKQQQKQYRIDNAEERNQYNKQYRIDNAEAIKKREQKKITCECGAVLSLYLITRHKRSKKHIRFLEQ